MTDHGLRARRLVVTLGGKPILRGVDVAFTPGRVHAIVGPNGCGKTTLIRALCGAIRPTQGAVELDGVPLRSLSTSKLARHLAVVWQGGGVPEDITVERLITHGRYAHTPWWSVRRSGHDPVVGAVMRQTGVEQWAERQVATLSGGERQRVWIATALAQEPEILLLDEPTTFLDVAHQIDVLELIRRLNLDGGLTVVAVLHDLTQAARYCDHVTVLGNGAVLREGPPRTALRGDCVASDFDVEAWTTRDPAADLPVIAPRARVRLRSGAERRHSCVAPAKKAHPTHHHEEDP